MTKPKYEKKIEDLINRLLSKQSDLSYFMSDVSRITGLFMKALYRIAITVITVSLAMAAAMYAHPAFQSILYTKNGYSPANVINIISTFICVAVIVNAIFLIIQLVQFKSSKKLRRRDLEGRAEVALAFQKSIDDGLIPCDKESCPCAKDADEKPDKDVEQ